MMKVNIEKRIERLERSRLASGGQRIDTIIIHYTGEPNPTDEEVEIARAEFIEKYGKPSLITIEPMKGITSARVKGEYIELPYSSQRLRELRAIRINNLDKTIPPRPFSEITEAKEGKPESQNPVQVKEA